MNAPESMPPAVRRPVTHVVRVDRRKGFSSGTLDGPAVERLQSAFGATRWWRDRWAARGFLDAARDVMRQEGGLAILGPGMSFDVPPPFSEMFEPIEIGRGLGYERERLKVLSGEAPTRQEKLGRIGMVIGGVVAVAMGAFLLVSTWGGIRVEGVLGIGGFLAVIAIVIALVVALQRRSGRWFLIPSGIAVVRRPPRPGHPPRVTVLSREDTTAVFRWVSTGKTTVLYLELWTHAGKRFRRPVSEREAISVLAAWQSRQSAPPDERLQELVSW